MDVKAAVVCTEKAIDADTINKTKLSEPAIATGEKVCRLLNRILYRPIVSANIRLK